MLLACLIASVAIATAACALCDCVLPAALASQDGHVDHSSNHTPTRQDGSEPDCPSPTFLCRAAIARSDSFAALGNIPAILYSPNIPATLSFEAVEVEAIALPADVERPYRKPSQALLCSFLI